MFEQALIESGKRRVARHKLLSLPGAAAAHVGVLALVGAVQIWAVDEVPAPVDNAIWVKPVPMPAGPSGGGKTPKPRLPESAPRTATPVQPTAVEPLAEKPAPVEQTRTSTGVPGAPEENGKDDPGGGREDDSGGIIVGPAEPVEERAEQVQIVGGEVMAPTLVRRIDPAYPELARLARREGVVIVQATVDRHGNVVDATVLRDDVRFGADEAVLRAVRQWRYEPATVQGRPVAVLLTITVAFHLQ